MGQPLSSTVVVPSIAPLDPEVETAHARALADNDALRHAPRANALYSLAALLLALGPSLPGSSVVYGAADADTVRLFVLVAGSGYESAALALRTAGVASRAYRALALVDGVTFWGGLLAIIYASGSSASPLWAVTLLAAPLAPAEPLRSRLVLGTILTTHALTAAAFYCAGHVGHALFCVVPLLVAILGHSVGARITLRAVRARAERDVLRSRSERLALKQERDQIARALHDGIGADVTALLLSLRRAAARDPQAEHLAARAQQTLVQLRDLVKTLRQD